MVGRGQDRRAVDREQVGDAELLRDRERRDLQSRGSYEDVAILGRGHDRLELRGDGTFDHATPLFGRGCRRRGVRLSGRAQLRADRRDRHAETFDPLAKIRRHAQANLGTQRLQLQRQRNQRLNIASRPDCGKQHAHQISSWAEYWACSDRVLGRLASAWSRYRISAGLHPARFFGGASRRRCASASNVARSPPANSTIRAQAARATARGRGADGASPASMHARSSSPSSRHRASSSFDTFPSSGVRRHGERPATSPRSWRAPRRVRRRGPRARTRGRGASGASRAARSRHRREPDGHAGRRRAQRDRHRACDRCPRVTVQVAQRADAVEASHVVLVVEPLVSLRPRRGREQPDVLVVVEGAHRQAGGVRQLADTPAASARRSLLHHRRTIQPHVTSGASTCHGLPVGSGSAGPSHLPAVRRNFNRLRRI
jgi:hypothetical protein